MYISKMHHTNDGQPGDLPFLTFVDCNECICVWASIRSKYLSRALLPDSWVLFWLVSPEFKSSWDQIRFYSRTICHTLFIAFEQMFSVYFPALTTLTVFKAYHFAPQFFFFLGGVAFLSFFAQNSKFHENSKYGCWQFGNFCRAIKLGFPKRNHVWSGVKILIWFKINLGSFRIHVHKSNFIWSSFLQYGLSKSSFRPG